MVQLGYTLSSEEFRPNDLVAHSRLAEEAGFSFASISDHYHPWVDAQGHSPFVWSTLGGIAQVTEKLELMTGVTCPIIRTHPAIIAQATATVADMLPGRFLFGVGTGEYLNEHITGEHWPPISRRQDMLVEALDVIRDLWQGGYTTYHGQFFKVENARLYTLPETLPPVIFAAAGPESAKLAGEHGDGLVSTAPDKDVVDAYVAAGGDASRVYGQVTVCWQASKDEAIKTMLEVWPNSGLSGQLSQELALPSYFEAAAELVTPEVISEQTPCGPEVQPILDSIQEYVDAGFTHIYVHQVGENQQEFIDMARREILPNFSS
jgi:G6PDH family F420-dependent oxidoreductase